MSITYKTFDAIEDSLRYAIFHEIRKKKHDHSYQEKLAPCREVMPICFQIAYLSTYAEFYIIP